MACFLVPTAEAIVVTAISHKVTKEERANDTVIAEHASDTITWSRKLNWLKNMLWGGSLLLLLEHMWHGEVVPWPPFLTAMLDPGDTAEMLHEMATVGVGMAIIVTLVWAIMVAVVTYVPAVRSAVQGERA